MALLDLFWGTAKPGWMSRDLGRKYVEVCLTAYDGIVEGLFQARMGMMGADPHPSNIPRISNDTGLVPGLYETARDYVFRRRRWKWSWRASGLPGVANLFVDAADWVDLGGGIPIAVSGTPTEIGNVLRIDAPGVIGVPGIAYSFSTNGGATFSASTALNLATTIAVGNVLIEFRNGQILPAADLPLRHGGRGLRLNDLGAPDRAVAAASPAGDESLLYEIAKVIGPCRIRLISADGTWWTRESDGYTWRLSGGPWAWNPTLDADPTYWSRGVIVIDSPPGIDPWEMLNANAHSLDEPQASFGTTAVTEWWNRLLITIATRKPANMLVHSVILNFDATKFDPSDVTTCPEDTWYKTSKDDGLGNSVLSRPVHYAWFSGEL